MKKLKFSDPTIIAAIQAGTVTNTWRLHDDKQLMSGETIELTNARTGESFGRATITETAEKPLKLLNDHDMVGHETYPDDHAVYDHLHHYYGNDITSESIVKIIHFTYEPMPVVAEASPSSIAGLHEEVVAHTDGGSRGNPGPSASGFVLHDKAGNLLVAGGEYLGITTNNQAEYQAVLLALEHAQRLGARKVSMYMDSLLVANQMNGIYKIRNRDLWPIHERIKQLKQQFTSVTFQHVRREMNKLADAEVNRVLDANR